MLYGDRMLFQLLKLLLISGSAQKFLTNDSNAAPLGEKLRALDSFNTELQDWFNNSAKAPDIAPSHPNLILWYYNFRAALNARVVRYYALSDVDPQLKPLLSKAVQACLNACLSTQHLVFSVEGAWSLKYAHDLALITTAYCFLFPVSLIASCASMKLTLAKASDVSQPTVCPISYWHVASCVL